MSSPRPPTILELFQCMFPCLCTFTFSCAFFYYYVFLQDPTRYYRSTYGANPPHLNFNHSPFPTNLTLYFPQHFSYPPNLTLPPLGKVPECNCERPLIYFYQGQQSSPHPNKTTIINSSCSDPGTFLSPLQKVISYSLYLFPDEASPSTTLQFYLEGLQINLFHLRQFYPGYTLRLYTNLPKGPTFCQFYCSNPDLFWCNITTTPLYGDQSKMYFTTWRFLPLGDPSVDLFLSRDLDSVVGQRESAVVQDWLQLPEKKAIHLMRDKHLVHNVPILGGMWGAKNEYFWEVGNGTSGEAARLLGEKIRNKSKVDKFILKRDTGFDQKMLQGVVFEGMKGEIVAYDSYHCEDWRTETMVRPFPVRRLDNKRDFVGNVGFGREEYQLEKCPLGCRPPWGKDWEYC